MKVIDLCAPALLTALLLATSTAWGQRITPEASGKDTDDHGDSVYIGDNGNTTTGVSTVDHFNAAGSFLSFTVPSDDCATSPVEGCVFGATGLLVSGRDLLVANQNVGLPINGEILKYDRKTGIFDSALIPGTDPEAPCAPRGIVLDHKTLYVADLGGCTTYEGFLWAYDADTGALIGSFDTTGFAGAFFPRGVVIGPDGLLYVSICGDLNPGSPSSPNPNFDPLVGYVLRFDRHTMKLVDVFIASDADNSYASGLHRPEGLVFSPEGKLYITSFRADATDTDKVLIFDGPCNKTSGALRGEIDLDVAGGPRAYAQALLFGPKGRLFVPISGNGPDTGSVRRYDNHENKYDTFVKAGGQLGAGWYLTFGNTDPATLNYQPE